MLFISILQLNNPWYEAQSGINELLVTISSLLSVVFILVAIVTLALGIYQMFQGDKDSAKRLLMWFIGFVLGSIFLNLLIVS